MRYPLLPPAVALLAGTCFLNLKAPEWTLDASCGVLLAAAWICYARSRFRIAALLAGLTLFPAGGLNWKLQEEKYASHLLPPKLVERASDSYADLSGTVLRLPRSFEDRYEIDVAVDSLHINNSSIGFTFNARISIARGETNAPLPAFLPGDRIEIAAKIFAVRGFQNPGALDQVAYLKSESIHQRGYAKSPLLVHKIADSTWGLRRLAGWLRRDFSEKLRAASPDVESGDLACALILGERDRLTQGLQESMRRSGLYHLLAISGGNFAMFAWMMFMLLKFIRVPERPTLLIVFATMLLYAATVEFEASVMRAFFMISVYLTARFFDRDHQLLNSLAIAILVSVAFQPWIVDDAGFQLTFLATALLILFAPRLMQLWGKRGGWLKNATVVNIAAGLGLAPYLAYHFNRVTLGGILLNYAAIPLSGLIMGIGVCAYAAGYVGGSTITGWMLSHSTRLFVLISGAMPYPSILSYRIVSPPAWLIWCFYALLATTLIAFQRRLLRRAQFIALAFAGLFSIWWPFSHHPEGLRFTSIDVGQGDSTLVEFPDGHCMLIDGGGSYEDTFDIGANVVAPYLFRRGVGKIDIVVVSHAHPDHVNGLRYIVANFPVGQVWEGINPTNDPFYALFKNCIPSGVAVKQVHAGDRFMIGDVSVEILHPETVQRHDVVKNDDSLVIRVIFGQSAALLPGDIEKPTINDLTGSHATLRAILLKCPHHGSRSSITPDFVAAVSPRVLLVSAGQGNRWGLPHFDVIDAYRKAGAVIFRTDICGAVSIELDRNGGWRRVDP